MAAAAEQLGRSLNEAEQLFVTQRQGFLAIEAISDIDVSPVSVALGFGVLGLI
ncbi:hypothetical protein [Curvibacter sp. AEP1-3]|uniref:hypothetical protein n=1 Tax=Curvibacter sp. AEP1-3 TaxID=1844971 RepID=UPI0012FB1653|nr:hypothetical protein [Curvibacter sp. AEP1-3]